jgi:hypothetical protein
MKQYLEIVEQLTATEKEEQMPEILRVEVKDEAEAKEKIKDLKDIVRNNKCFLHTHHHYADSKLNKPCEVKEINE